MVSKQMLSRSAATTRERSEDASADAPTGKMRSVLGETVSAGITDAVRQGVVEGIEEARRGSTSLEASSTSEERSDTGGSARLRFVFAALAVAGVAYLVRRRRSSQSDDETHRTDAHSRTTNENEAESVERSF
ncbi:hypothetical protein VB773_22505 [Haloarculaceae archaeon H-GB2-1]|nr:hypothetical protein [Haloarculaceae archaeon H-GB1-1]MEA5389476.1 hypothetical protein [Haloarculaceae archaeon H-GB11]MEA5410072.1 hypothetical protein [Haloarculaceae archaeon H-GB2-1]